MKNKATDKSITILSLYPNAVGVGYVFLEVPQNLKEFGVIKIRPISNQKILGRVAKFIDFFNPEIVVIKDGNDSSSRHSKRVIQLIENIATYANEAQVPVYRYTRQQIRDTFELQGAKSKYEIAHRTTDWFPQLVSRAPKVRKPWLDEDYNMGIFDALSLAITHLHLTK